MPGGPPPRVLTEPGATVRLSRCVGARVRWTDGPFSLSRGLPSERRRFTRSPAAPPGATFRRASSTPRRPLRRVGYGPLAPVRDETTRLPLLELPSGFRYRSFGWIGDPLARGLATPGLHDGMAAFPARSRRVRLVRNHELRAGPAFASRPIYDPNGCGGTTTIEFDTRTGSVVDGWVSLAGTAVNCAGGPTPGDRG